MFERLFKLSEHNTTIRTELVAGVTTFLTMSYIIFVNPDILSTTGMDRDAIFVATCIAAALGSAVMALVANWPIGMAPGMGLNAFFAFTVVAALGFTWQQALGAVFISGLIFVFLTVTGIRGWLIQGIPHSLRSAIATGIGLFLGIIALKNAGIVVDNPATLVGLGSLKETGPLLAIFGFFVIAVLDALRVKGAILIGILAVTVLSWVTGVSQFQGEVDDQLQRSGLRVAREQRGGDLAAGLRPFGRFSFSFEEPGVVDRGRGCGGHRPHRGVLQVGEGAPRFIVE